MTIRKEGGKYVLVSKTGSILGTHEKESDAQKQEAAISANERKQKTKKKK